VMISWHNHPLNVVTTFFLVVYPFFVFYCFIILRTINVVRKQFGFCVLFWIFFVCYLDVIIFIAAFVVNIQNYREIELIPPFIC